MKREREYSFSLQKEIKMIILIFVLGSCLGVFSKYLDFHQATLPTLLQIIDQKCDLHNYLGTFGPWLMIALIISIYAPSPRSAAYLVFTFFFGMVLSYYLYCYYICGFYSLSYIMIWVCFTILSPILGYLCWFSLGKDILSFLISSLIMSVFFNLTFSYGCFYLDVKSWLNVLLLLIVLLMLHKGLKEDLLMIVLGMSIGILSKSLLPIYFW